MFEKEKEKSEISETCCVHCEHYTTCFKLRHDRSIFNKGCEDFEKDLLFLELIGKEDEEESYFC